MSPEIDHHLSAEEPSTEAYLFAYLRTIATRGEGLPPAFCRCPPARAGSLWRPDSGSLCRDLEESLLWIYKSHQRVQSNRSPTVLGILERRLRCAQSLAPHPEESFRTLLDRMISMTGNVFPTVSDPCPGSALSLL